MGLGGSQTNLHPYTKNKSILLLQERREEKVRVNRSTLTRGRAGKMKFLNFFAIMDIRQMLSYEEDRSAILFAILWLCHPKEFHNIHITTCQKTVLIRTVYSRARNTTDITVITTHHSGQLSQYDFLFPCAVLTARSSAHTRSLTCKA